MHTVSASMIEFTVSRRGAQLVSLVKDDKQYICANSPFWQYSSPTMFPIVGRLNNDTLRYQGKSYKLMPHGFVRTRDFICVDDRPLTYRLSYDYDSLDVYPFPFVLTVSFQPVNSELIITTRAQNPGEDTIWFSMGSCPALKVPFYGGRFEDYTLEFNFDEHTTRLPLNSDALLTGQRITFADQRRIPLSYDLFKDGALIFDNLKSTRVSIRRGDRAVTVRADNVPCWGIWTKPNAPFLCIEPSCGLPDRADFTDDFTKKPGVLSLEAGKSFSMQYSIFIDA